MSYRWVFSCFFAVILVLVLLPCVSAEIAEIRAGTGIYNLELTEEKYLFSPGDKIFLWVRIPIIERPGTFWFVIKKDGNVVRKPRPIKVTIRDRNGYRLWRWNVFYEPGTYQVRVVDSKGTVVAAGTFRVH